MMRPSRFVLRHSLLLTLCAALPAGCLVGPDYAAPDTDLPPGWTGASGAVSARPMPTPPVDAPADPVRWWAVFGDATLSSLIERAYAGNLSIAQAQARIRQARAASDVAASGLFPTVDASASASRSRTRGAAGGVTGNFFRAGFDATWEIDVFGGIRRGVEAADARALSAYYDRESLLVSLGGEVATIYFTLRGAQRQLAIATRNVEAQRRTLDLTQQRLDAGFVSALDVANARANSTQTESQIPTFDAQVRTSVYALSVLLGLEPSALLDELSPETPPPGLPADVPVGLPSDLLLRRPDLRKAQADLHAATAAVGVAIADQYPRFSLTGSFGVQGNRSSALVSIADRFWSIGPAVSLPLFTGGRIEGNIEQARAQAEQAVLAYRQSVLTALQDVETALATFTREQQRRGALADAAEANRQAVDLSLQLYGAGRTDFLNVLSAQRQLYATEALLTQSETTIGVNLVALFKALGGGWDAPPIRSDEARPSDPQ